MRIMCARIARDLRSEGHEIADYVALGAMIEIPAAALALPTFIGGVDFLSIGTNDLIQYLLAADRNNDALGELYTPLHPAVIRMLRDLIRMAKSRNRPIAVCGEIAGDARLAPMLLALGLEQFSLHPTTLLEVRRTIRNCDLDRLRANAPALLRARERVEIERWIDAQRGH